MTISDAQSCGITYNCQSDDSGLRGRWVGVGGWVCLLLVRAEKKFLCHPDRISESRKNSMSRPIPNLDQNPPFKRVCYRPLKLFVIVTTLNQNKLARLSQARFILESWDPRLPERSTLD
jgi:hypothetical protein